MINFLLPVLLCLALPTRGHSLEPIPVVGYHEFGGPPEYAGGPRYDVHGLNISVDTFRKELGMMYAAGYRPVSMRDVILKRVNLAAGARPIVLTFDDGRPTQFRYLADGRIDPDCAVGVMATFHHLHPDWPMRGSFYLIAGSDENGVPFDQEGTEAKKVRQLIKWGFEIGNHTLTHPSFKTLSARQITKEIGGCDRYLKRLIPGLKVDTIALPYGDLPLDQKKWPLLRRPSPNSSGYHNIGVLLFQGGLCPSPFSRSFDPYLIPRLAPTPQLEVVLKKK